MKKLILPFLLLVLVSCSKEDPEPAVVIDSPTLELKFDKEHQFVVKKGAETIDASTVTWKSSDELVGTVNASGLFKGRKIGETIITGKSSDGKIDLQSKVTITPYYTTCAEPVTEWGASIATIKSKEKRTLFNETAAGAAFTGENAKMRMAIYLLEAGKLVSSGLSFTPTNEVGTELGVFFSERYPEFEVGDDQLFFVSDSKAYGILIGIDETLGIFALYSPLDAGGRKMEGAKKNDLAAMKKFLAGK